MKEKLLALLKQPWAIVTGIIGFLLLVIKILSNKNKDLGAKVEGAEASKTDAILEQQQKDLAAQHQKEIDEIEKEKGRKLSDQELNDFLKKL